jgi:hypothetical protein
MRKVVAGLLLFLALILPAASSPAWGAYGGGGWHGGWNGGWHGGWYGGWNHGWYGGWGGSVVIGGPWWWGPTYPYPYYGYYPPAYYAYPPPIVQGPSVYIQQQPAPSESLPEGYWYYCASAKAYYPTVQTCREAWIKVPPTPR